MDDVKYIDNQIPKNRILSTNKILREFIEYANLPPSYLTTQNGLLESIIITALKSVENRINYDLLYRRVRVIYNKLSKENQLPLKANGVKNTPNESFTFTKVDGTRNIEPPKLGEEIVAPIFDEVIANFFKDLQDVDIDDYIENSLFIVNTDKKIVQIPKDDIKGAQPPYPIYLYNTTTHGANRPQKPITAEYDEDTDTFSNVDDGWTDVYPDLADEATEDYWRSEARYNPKDNSTGTWTTPQKIHGDVDIDIGLYDKSTVVDAKDEDIYNRAKRYTNDNIKDQPVLALGTGVAEVSSHVAYQAPSLPLGSLIMPQSFSTLLGIINNTAAHNFADYAVPTSLASTGSGGQAGANYAVETISHLGSDRLCLVITLKERIDTFTTILFYVGDSTVAFPTANHYGGKELSLITSSSPYGYSIQNLTTQTAANHEGFVAFSDGDKKIYIYQTGRGTEYLGWVNLERTSAQKGEKGDPPDLNVYYTKDEINTRDANTLTSAQGYTYPKATIDSKIASGDTTTLAAAKRYTDDNAVGKFVNRITLDNADDDKIKLGYSDNSTGLELDWLPNPGNTNGSSTLLKVERIGSKKRLLGSTTEDLYEDLNDLSDSAADSKRLKGQHIRTGSIAENRLDAATQAKLNSSGGGDVDLSGYYTKPETDAKIAEEDQKVKDSSRVLLASWRGEDGDPATAGVALPQATYIGGASYNSTDDAVEMTGSSLTSGIEWINDEIDFTRFAMTARITMQAEYSAIIYFGYSTTPIGSNGGWDYNNAGGIALYIKTGTFNSRKFGDSNSKNGIYLLAQGGGYPGQIRDALFDIGVNQSGEQTYRFARWKNKVRIWIDDDYKGELTIPAGATTTGGKFGWLGYRLNTTFNWQLKDIIIEQVNIYDAEDDLGLPVVSGGSIDGSNLTLARRGADDQVIPLPGGDGKFVDDVKVENGKIVLGYSDDSTPIESPQFLPSPANQAHARVMVTAARNAASEINLVATTSTDVTGTINALSATAPANEKIDARALRDGTVSEAKLDTATKNKLNASGTIADGSINTAKLAALAVTGPKLGVDAVTASKIAAGVISESKLNAAVITKLNSGKGANKAIEELASDMQWKVEVQTYIGNNAPASPATIGISYSIGRQIGDNNPVVTFVFPTSTTKDQVDALVLDRNFAMSIPEGVFTFTPTRYAGTAVISGGFHAETYYADLELDGQSIINSNPNNNLQTTLYRGIQIVGGEGGGSVETYKDIFINSNVSARNNALTLDTSSSGTLRINPSNISPQAGGKLNFNTFSIAINIDDYDDMNKIKIYSGSAIDPVDDYVGDFIDIYKSDINDGSVIKIGQRQFSSAWLNFSLEKNKNSNGATVQGQHRILIQVATDSLSGLFEWIINRIRMIMGNSAGGVNLTNYPTNMQVDTKISAISVKESKKDVFISPAHTTNGQYAAVRANNPTDLAVGTTQPTPPEAGATEYGSINIAILYADWNKCHKVGISTSHATSVMLNAEEFIYKDDITSTVTFNELVSADGRNSARVRLFENQNALGSASSTTHRLEIEGTVGRVYIGKVRLVNLEVA